MAPIYPSTYGELIRDLAGMMDDWRSIPSTADTAGTNTFFKDSTQLVADLTVGPPLFKGAWAFPYDRALTEARAVSGYISVGMIQPAAAFASAIASGTRYVLTGTPPALYGQTLNQAMQLLVKSQFKPYADRSIIIGSPIRNGTFSNWTNGTSAAPDNWVLAGTNATVAQSTSLVRGGPFGCTVSNGNNQSATLTQTVTLIGKYAGSEAIPLRLSAYCVTAGRATFTMDFGGGNTVAVTHGGTGWEDLVTAGINVPVGMTQFTVYLTISTGTVVSVTLCIVRAPFGNDMLGGFYPLDPTFKYIGDQSGVIYISNSLPVGDGTGTAQPTTADAYDIALPSTAWDISLEGTRKIVLPSGGMAVGAGNWNGTWFADFNDRIVYLPGWVPHAALTSGSDVWTGNAQALLWRAKAMLMGSPRWRGKFSGTEIQAAIAASAEAESRTEVDVPAGAIEVETN